jgi:hypothetical protein
MTPSFNLGYEISDCTICETFLDQASDTLFVTKDMITCSWRCFYVTDIFISLLLYYVANSLVRWLFG